MDLILRPGLSSVAAIGASPNANGASVAGTVLTLQPASASFGGLITAGTQTIAGAKTFLSLILSQPAGTAGISLDPNAATGAFALALSPANLTAARRWSFPNRSDTVAGLGAQIFTGSQVFIADPGGSETVRVSGGIRASGLSVFSAGIISDNSQPVRVSGNAAAYRGFTWETDGVQRWFLSVSGGTESGANAGSNLELRGYSDGGAGIIQPISFTRQTGLTTIGHGLLVDGTGHLRRNGAAGNYRGITIETSGVTRWLIAGNYIAESGSNAGTNFEIARYADNGSYLSSPISINRASGLVFLDTTVVGTDPGGAELLRVGGTLAVNSATLIKTYTTLTNGAAAAVGTLTNAPAAGNPTKWFPINDNGTTRYVPSW